MDSNDRSPFDVYGNTDKLDSPILDALATRLEARGQHAGFASMMQEYFAAMQIDQAATVLDLGCGTGVAARAIAQRDAFTGHITGIDLSDHLVAAAQTLAQDNGIGNQIDFLVGDTRSLNLQDNAFDAVVAHTLISHVDAYEDAINEMARVVKPQGYVTIFDGDYASLTFGHPDVDEGRRLDELIIAGIITQPRVMRQMPHLLKAAGLELVTTFAYVICDVGQAEFWASAVESFRNLLPASGVMTAETAHAWADDRVRDSENNVFFASSNYLTYIARKR